MALIFTADARSCCNGECEQSHPLMENTARYARRVRNSTRDHEGGAGPEGRTRKAVCALLQQSECAGGMKASSACGSPLIGPLASCTPVVVSYCLTLGWFQWRTCRRI